MPADVILYAVSDDPADGGLYPVQGKVTNGRIQLYSALAVDVTNQVTAMTKASDVLFHAYDNTGVNANSMVALTVVGLNNFDPTKLFVLDRVVLEFGAVPPNQTVLLAFDVIENTSGSIVTSLYLTQVGTLIGSERDSQISVKWPDTNLPVVLMRNLTAVDITGGSSVDLWGHYE